MLHTSLHALYYILSEFKLNQIACQYIFECTSNSNNNDVPTIGRYSYDNGHNVKTTLEIL